MIYLVVIIFVQKRFFSFKFSFSLIKKPGKKENTLIDINPFSMYEVYSDIISIITNISTKQGSNRE